jgi:hypothetical protein
MDLVSEPPTCGRCGQSTDHTPLLMSEILSVTSEALLVVDDPVRANDATDRRLTRATAAQFHQRVMPAPERPSRRRQGFTSACCCGPGGLPWPQRPSLTNE